MRIRNIICAAVAVAVVGLFTGCETEKGEAKKGKETQAQLMAEAKITKEQAQNTALARVPGGTIKEGEIERENGKLIWSFDIATPGTKDITEVNVDAMTGAVVGVDKESPAQEKDEAKKEKKEKDDDEKDEKK